MQNIKTSEQINEIVSALSKAQGEMKPAVFNKTNPHFKSKYADFSSCMDTCRSPLSKNGLAVVQTPQTIDGKLTLVTLLAHTSGQWMTGEFPLVAVKMDSQGIGSAMTYAKRYSLCGMLGIVADEDANDDDDGEAAVGRPPFKAVKPEPKALEVISKDQLNELKELLSYCPAYKVKVEASFMKLNIKDLSELPLIHFSSIKKNAIEEAEKLKTDVPF